jgi:peptidyl-prolyl cis-trans isomerase C
VAVRLSIIGFALLVILCASCASEGGGEGEVLAEVGGTTITHEDVTDELMKMPGYNRAKYEGKAGERRLLDRLVEQEVLYLAADDAGYREKPDVKEQIDFVTKRAMIQAFYRDEIEGQVQVTDEDIREYYEEHPEQFHQEETVRARHIMVSSRQKAEELRRRLLDGEVFVDLARAESEDAATAQAGGLLGYITWDGRVKTVGNDPDFVETVMNLKAGQVSDIIETDKGYHLVKVEEHIEEGTKPLEEVSENIRQRLIPQMTRERFEETVQSLREEYNVSINEEFFAPKKTAQAIFEEAQEATNPMRRIDIYEQLLRQYPDSEYAAQAQFMIGFIYSEELDSKESARIAFEKVINDYPENELVESAKWMIENMDKDMPEVVEEPDFGTGE